MSKVSYIPKDYNSVTPYLVVKDAAQAIDYYKKVFGATETVRMPGPDGKIGHAELKIGNSHIMLSDETRECGNAGFESGELVCVLTRCGPGGSTRCTRGRENSETSARPVLRRPQRLHSGSVWTSLGHRHARGRRIAQGHGRANEETDDAGRVISAKQWAGRKPRLSWNQPAAELT